MSDVRVRELAGRQFNRVSRRQLLDLGMSIKAIDRRVASGQLSSRRGGVFAVAPVLDHDPWGRWMEATLTQPSSLLSRRSASVAYGILDREGPWMTITRPGSGGPVVHDGIRVHRSSTLDADRTELRGIPITSVARVLLDLASDVGDRALARALREAVRLERISMGELGNALGRYRGRRGSRRLAEAVARYRGLPLARARSGAEIRAMELLRAANIPLPRLNWPVAGEEADLSWPHARLIIEIDGGPFHLDKGEDARKEAAWRGAGWEVRRLPSDDVYEHPGRLLALAANPVNVAPTPP